MQCCQIIFCVHVCTPVTPRQPTRLTTTTAVKINRREYGENTCLGTTCHGSSWSVAGCSQTGIFSLWLLVDFSSVCCSLSHWLSWDNRSKIPAQTLIYAWMFASPWSFWLDIFHWISLTKLDTDFILFITGILPIYWSKKDGGRW